jgi:hypothetical protein
MFAEKKTLSFWRQRRPNFLKLERALAPDGRRDHHSDAEHAVVAQRRATRRAEASKGKVGQKA